MKPKDIHHYLKMKGAVTEGYTPPNGAAIHAMTEGEICQEIAKTVAISTGAFRTLGKLRYELEEKTGTSGIYAKLAEYGVDAEDISNAGPAAITYREMVIPGHMTEDTYDGITFGLCRAITRTLGKSAKSPTKVTLTGDVIAQMAKKYKAKNQLQRELESIAAEGMCIEEVEKKVKEEAEAKAKADAEAAAAAALAAAATPPEPTPPAHETTGKKQPGTPPPAPPVTPVTSEDDDVEIDTPEPETPKSKAPAAPTARGYTKLDGIVTDLENGLKTDGLDLSPEQAGKLCERLAALAQVLAEWAACDTDPRTPADETQVALKA